MLDFNVMSVFNEDTLLSNLVLMGLVIVAIVYFVGNMKEP